MSTMFATFRGSALATVRARPLSHYSPLFASVMAPSPFQHTDDETPGQRVASHGTPPERKTLIEKKRERKLREYESKLKVKAMREGLSVGELKEKLTEVKAKSIGFANGEGADMARRIKERSAAEKKRKEESGLTDSNGEGPVKPLSKILDIAKLAQATPETIGQLWTGYHTLKNKLSAVIPSASYTQLVQNATKYPQFVLPLPRTAPGEVHQEGFQMQFMQWGFLPLTKSSLQSTTVLFTPLAEYKLKQEFSQPALILTHYTDLADEKGIVLLRGEVTGAEEGKGSFSQAEAQLLSMTLQRFYLPKPNDTLRPALLETFYKKPEEFNVDELVKASFEL